MELRIATDADIDNLFDMNEEFNGTNCTTKELLRKSIVDNEQEMENVFKAKIINGFQLLTGKSNIIAQAFYEKPGYNKTDELMYRKKLKSK